MREYIIVLIVLLVSSSFVSCGKSGTQSIEPLKKAMLDGEHTLETVFNGIAGTDGSLSWYSPPENPDNSNFKLLGVKAWSKTLTLDCILSIDTSNMTATIQSASFNGKIIRYNQSGILDNREAALELTELILKSALEL
jgi:hypothetical protein